MSRSCSHKIVTDFRRPIGGDYEWECSDCGKWSRWTDGHMWKGSLECKRCGYEVIDAVTCGCTGHKEMRQR